MTTIIKTLKKFTQKLDSTLKRHSKLIIILLVSIMFCRFYFAWKFGNNDKLPTIDLIIALLALITTENELVKIIISNRNYFFKIFASMFALHPIFAIILGFFTNIERIPSFLIIYSGFLGLISYFLNIVDD